MDKDNGVHCIMPPSPELEEEIIRAKRRFVSGQTLAESLQNTRLDARSLALILTRPPKTRAHTLVSPTKEFAPVLGTRKALVLLVDFADKAATQTQAHFTKLLFSLGAYASGSMRDFYREVSYNQVDVTGAVSGTGGPTAGWYRAPKPKAHYTNNDYGFGAYPQNAQKLVEDVVSLANPAVNFADYDNDGDGIVDALVIIASGSGAEATGNTNDIWSHKWSVSPINVDGVKVTNYFMAPEDGRVGVMSHELGHLLFKWPDLYDTDYSSRGTGRWDLMAGGSWNNGGDTPAHPCAWAKSKVGWLSVNSIFNAEQTVTLQPYATNKDVYKLPIGATNSDQYFLLSNRRKGGFDAHLPGEGLIIEHVDDNQSNNTDETHYLVDIEQCDGKLDLNKNANSGDATDPYPDGGQDKFTFATAPSSKAYDGSDSKVEVTAISDSGVDVTAKVKVGATVTTGPAWYNNRKVLQTFASAHPQNAWGNIDGLGWRKVKPGAPDGVINVFDMLCEAAATGRKVNVFADANEISIAYLL